jgi:hypothetical protein
MLKKFSPYMKKLRKIKSKVLILGAIISLMMSFVLPPSLSFAWEDAPIDRNFMRIPRYLDTQRNGPSRWIWLQKVRDEYTLMTLGQGVQRTRNAIATLKRPHDDISMWDYAYFIRLTPGSYFTKGSTHELYFALVALEVSNNLIRTARVYKLQENMFSEVGTIENYVCPADLPLFDTRGDFDVWLEAVNMNDV